MNRRGFLQLLGAAGAMAATGLSLEELLAPQRTIFLPAIQQIEFSTFISNLWSNQMLAVYKNNIVLANIINRNYSQYARRANTGSYIIFEDRIRSYQGSL